MVSPPQKVDWRHRRTVEMEELPNAFLMQLVSSVCLNHVQQDLEPMRCETTSSVKECALRARSTHGVHHAIVEVNIVIGVVLGEVLVAHVVPLVVDAVIGLALGLICSCCCRFRRSLFKKNFPVWETLYTLSEVVG